MKKLCSSLLILMLLCTMLSTFALPAAAATSGTTGDCTWSLDGTVLTISGNGAMGSYVSAGLNKSPWKYETITEVIIEPGVITVGSFSFYACTDIIKVTLPDSVTAIDQYAFLNCGQLSDVVMSKNIDYIGMGAFKGCSALTSIHLSVKLETVGGFAFDGCDNLKDVWYEGTFDQREQIGIPGFNESLINAEWHYNNLLVCPHSYDNGCDDVCNICGSARAISHSYSNACDTTCNTCGDPRTVGTHQYVNNCDTACDICGAVREITHTYANACDTSCDVCGAPREITHSFGEYVYNNDATMEADGTRTRVCTVCGYSETVTAPGTLIVLSNPFTDVKTGVYYEKPVLWAVNKGITNGMGNGQFKPNETCTRGQIVTFLWRAKGCPEPQNAVNSFADVAGNAYYNKAVLWAVEQGITNGTGAGKFSPNAECTREQIVTFLWRSQGKPVMGSANPFSDVAAGTYYHDAVLWAVDKGITKGTSATTFAPKDDCTRGQIVTFLYRCLA